MSTRVKGFRPKAKPAKPKATVTTTTAAVSEEASQSRWRTGLYWFLVVALVAIPFDLAPGYMHPYNKAFYLIVLTAAVALIVLWIAVGTKAIKLVYTPFFVGVGAWLLAKLVTTFTSILPATSFWGTYETRADGFVYALAVAVIACVLITLRLDTKRIVRLIHILGAQAVIFAVMTIAQAIQEGFFYQKVRPDSPLLNADFFISYTLLFWPLAIVLLVVAIKRRNWVKTAVYLVSVLILSGSLFVTLPTHLQTILLPSFENGKKDSSGILDAQSNVTASNFTADQQNMQRWSEWGLGLKLGSYDPLFGTGPSTTGNAFIQRQNQLDLSTWDHDTIMDNAHNDLIEQFSQEGLLGLGTYLFFWAMFIWVLLRHRQQIESAARPYAIGLGLGLICWFTFDQLLFTTLIVGIIEWTWIALLISMSKVAEPKPGFWPKLTLGTTSIGLIIISIFVIHGYIDDAYVFYAESVNATIKSGDFNNLSNAQVVYFAKQAAQQQAAAADDLPFVGYYANDAALSLIDLYIDAPQDPDRQQAAANALKYAKQAVADNPYAPGYIQTLGGIEYYLAPAGSPQEAAGIALMNKAIFLTPATAAWYNDAAAIASIKHDYRLARAYLEQGIKISKGTDRTGMEGNLARLPNS
jgi:O-Antigen ligase